ncbi:cell envelope integrity protein TolA [Aliivibrio logei]|uniref:cell envelope integrity protein TolA n=1 Tax=Aliivibrio logei TaxID=688 RepID=UPI0035C88D9A
MKSDNNYTFAIIVSVVLHLLLVAALLFGSNFSLDEKAKPNTIQAVVIDPNTIAKQASQIRQERERAERAEKERLKRLKQQAAQLEKNRKVEEDRIRKLKEQQVKEKKAARKAEDDRKKAVAAENERKRKAETAAKAEAARVAKVKADKEKAARASAEKARIDKERAAKAEKERLAKEKLAKEKAVKAEEDKKAKAEAERVAKAKAEAERKQKEAALNDIFAGLEDETVQNSSAKQQYIDDEVNRYGAIYTQMIQQNLLVDEAYVGKSCRVKIKLASSGLLLSVTTLNGDAQVCRAAKTAVTKVNVFPMPTDGDVVTKLTNINLTVEPE